MTYRNVPELLGSSCVIGKNIGNPYRTLLPYTSRKYEGSVMGFPIMGYAFARGDGSNVVGPLHQA